MPLNDRDRRATVYRKSLVAGLRGQRGALERQLIAEMRASIPVYGRMAEDTQEKLRAGVAFTVDLVLRLWDEQRDLTESERERLRSLGAERSQMGIPLDQVVAGVDLARSTGWTLALRGIHRLPGGLRGHLTADESIDFTGTLSLELDRAVDAIRTEMSAGYVAADRTSRAVRAQFFGAVLRGEVATEEQAVVRAAAHAINLHIPTGLVLVADRPGAPADAATSLLGLVSGSVLVSNPGAVIAHQVVVAPCPDAAAWDGWTRSAHGAVATVVPVAPVRGALALRAAYLDGLRTLRLAMARVGLQGRLMRAGATAFIRLLDEAAPERQQDLLAPLVAIRGMSNASELVDTIAAVLRNRGMTSAARELNAHRNTVQARIRQIEARTGLSLDDADDRLTLAAALYLHRLRGVGRP